MCADRKAFFSPFQQMKVWIPLYRCWCHSLLFHGIVKLCSTESTGAKKKSYDLILENVVLYADESNGSIQWVWKSEHCSDLCGDICTFSLSEAVVQIAFLIPQLVHFMS